MRAMLRNLRRRLATTPAPHEPTPARERALDPLTARVLSAVTVRGLSAAEEGWVERIEGRRRELIDIAEIVEYTDYGAGAPRSGRTVQEANAGHRGRQSVGGVTATASKDRLWGALLMRLVRDVRPQRCVELGAAVGISASYQAAALAMNGSGTLVTIEGAEALADITEDTLRSLGLAGVAQVRRGRFADVLPDVLEPSPDFVFVDGHHDGEATVAYFDQAHAAMGTGVIVLDDIDWSDGMRQAWDTVLTRPGLAATIDLGRVGIVVSGQARATVHCRLDYAAPPPA